MKALDTDLTGANRGNGVSMDFSVLSVSSCSNSGFSAIVGPEEDLTGANRGNGEGFSVFSVPSCSIPGINIYNRRKGDTDFKFLARDTSLTYVDNRPMLVAGEPELREYKAVFVVGDIEVSQFSDEITVNCAPLV